VKGFHLLLAVPIPKNPEEPAYSLITCLINYGLIGLDGIHSVISLLLKFTITSFNGISAIASLPIGSSNISL
jgi:hypothetical protein